MTSTPTEQDVAQHYTNASISASVLADQVRRSANQAMTDDDALAVRLALQGLDHAVNEGRRQLVMHLRAAGASWAQVGALLGISRQAAYERFGHLEQRRGE